MIRPRLNGRFLAAACAASLFCTAPARAAKAPDRLSGFKVELRAPGAQMTAATAVNSIGTVAGTCSQGKSDHAFVWQDGQFTLFDAPGATTTVPRGIDDQGVVVGHCFVGTAGAGFRMLGFIRQPDGSMETLERLDPFGNTTDCAVSGISSKGEMLGIEETYPYSFVYRGRPGAWKRIDAKFHRLEYGSINNSGVFVGTDGGWGTPVHRSAFVCRKKEKFETIEYPYAYLTICVGLNDQGEMVGRWGTSDRLACFYRDASGRCFWRDDARSIGGGANAISNNGYIVGYDLWSPGSGVGWLYRPGPRQSEQELSVPMRWTPAGEKPEGMSIAERLYVPAPAAPDPAPVAVPAPPPGPPYDGLIDRLSAELDPAVERNEWATVATQSIFAFVADTTRWEPYVYLGMAERHLLMKGQAYGHLSEGIRLAKADFEAHPDRTFINKHLATMYLERSWRAIDLRDFDGAGRDVWLARQADPGPRVDRQDCISQVIIDSRYMGNVCEKAARDYMDDPVVRAGRGIGRMPMLRKFRRSGAPQPWQDTKDDFEFYLSRVPPTGTNVALIRGYLVELDKMW